MFRTSFVALAAVFVVTLAASSGCGAVPEITFDDGDGGSGGPCTGTQPEICGDGIDNDCNGRTDCDDPACSSTYTCVDRVPSDWSVIAFAEGSRPPCPTGFADGADVRTVRGASGAPTCTCDCGGSSACADGKVVLALGADASCGGSTESLDVKTGCEKLNGMAAFAVGAGYIKATAPPTPSCNGNPPASPAPLRDGRTCTLVSKSAQGCSGSSPSSSCVPRVGGGYQICLQRAGASACPSGYSSARRAGTGAIDTRACGACTCTASPCTVSLSLYDSVNCGSPKATIATTGTCIPVASDAFVARGYETTVGGGCRATSASPSSGSLMLDGESTICCRSFDGGGDGDGGS